MDSRAMDFRFFAIAKRPAKNLKQFMKPFILGGGILWNAPPPKIWNGVYLETIQYVSDLGEGGCKMPPEKNDFHETACFTWLQIYLHWFWELFSETLPSKSETGWAG